MYSHGRYSHRDSDDTRASDLVSCDSELKTVTLALPRESFSLQLEVTITVEA